MGSRESKLGNIPKDDLSEASLPSTPILTEKTAKIDDFLMDPRSPSSNIARTPIEFLSTNKHLSSDLLSSATILCDDPRSPTVEFTRTPIIVNTDGKLNRLHNKNLDRVRLSDNIANKCLLDTPISKIRPPKLLESSPISAKVEINKRKSFVGLLETNIDYIETDLDVAQKEKYVQNNEETIDCDVGTEMIENQASVNTEEELNEKISVVNLDESQSEIESSTLKTDEEEIFAEEVILPPQNTTNIVNITADVKDFDKKLTNLIYEDDESIKLPKSNLLKENTNRTPLATRNNHSEPKKSVQKLKVSDQPRKSDGAISKIPVLKEKRLKKYIQCENTPPRNVNKVGLKAKKSQWDADKTLVI